MKTKPWWKKKEAWGSIVAFLALIATAFGYHIDVELLTNAIVALIGAAGAFVAAVVEILKKEPNDD